MEIKTLNDSMNIFTLHRNISLEPFRTYRTLPITTCSISHCQVTAKRPLKPLHENLCKNMARSTFTTLAHIIAHLIPVLCSNLLKAT